MAKMFRDLKVKLTPEEWAANAAQLGSAQEQLEQLEEEKRSATSALKARVDAAQEKISDLATKVRTREEVRAVECFERQDDRRYVVELFRADTGELIETRPMTASERHAAQNPELFVAPLRRASLDQAAADLVEAGEEPASVAKAKDLIETHGVERVAAAVDVVEARARRRSKNAVTPDPEV